MLSMESDNKLASRLDTLEKGVNILDNRVAQLDDKVTHVIQMNSEIMIQSNENFREMRQTLNDHRTELKKSIKQIRGNFTTKCQLILFALGLSAWTLFMAWVMWA
tara:strand:+ start:458 stop:772 length:315 start_codon:yes stop_codon:yes gene_type:complete